jgi:uncharacterized protein (DUF2249 family)
MDFHAKRKPDRVRDLEREGGAVEQEPPAWLHDLPPGRLALLDVRPLLDQGREPFPAIMGAVNALGADQVLKLQAPFEPVPLYGVLGRKGFNHWTRQVPSEGGRVCWEVFFYAEEALPEEAVEAAPVEEESGSLRELDVRGLEPPQPLERVLEVLETMAYGEVLLVHHHRNPLILFDLLHERGFVWRSKEIEDDYWQVRVWRRS